MSGYANAVHMESYFKINDENINSLYLKLNAGETVAVHIPYVLNQISFRDNYWKSIDEKEVGMTIMLYPVKKYICGIEKKG